MQKAFFVPKTKAVVRKNKNGAIWLENAQGGFVIETKIATEKSVQNQLLNMVEDL